MRNDDKDEEVMRLEDNIRHLPTEEQSSSEHSRLNSHPIVGRSTEGQIGGTGETRRIETHFPEPVRATMEDILLARRRHRSRPERLLRPVNNVVPEL
jgi:hypothetical protein